jgi:DNA-binding NtrC family response regulator
MDVFEEMHHKDLNQKLLLSIDDALIKGHADANLYLIFVSSSILYTCLYNQIEKANSISSIGLSLASDEIHPMVKAFFTQSRAKLLRIEGKIVESVNLMNEFLSLIDATCPRYNTYINNYIGMLASQGQLKEFGVYQFDNLNESLKSIHLLGRIESKIFNCVITGEIQEGLQLFEEYKLKPTEGVPYRLEVYQTLTKIISGDFKPHNYEDEIFKILAQTLDCLSSGKIEEALKNHQVFLGSDWPQTYMKHFIDYLPLHFEICLGKRGMANYLFQEKIKSGNVHYMDDLFMGRILLLENDLEGAEIAFSRLTENIKRFGAFKRLEFELQFAKEMKLPQILHLIGGWKKTIYSSTTKVKTESMLNLSSNVKGIGLLIGESVAVSRLKELVKKYANIKAPILVTGETGTGKELVSRAIHDEGPNSSEPFLAINCGALTDTLLQSELFGYEAGAFTGAQKQRKGIFEAAGKGTVFLDEFGDISPKLQVSLLRVLESGEIRLIGGAKTSQIECKIVIATNVDLNRVVVTKEFREDLFYRLARFEIKLPALRERLEDLPDLIHYFLRMNSKESGQPKSLSKELISSLMTYRWPGNIRELKNEIERACILNPTNDIIGVKDFDFTHLQAPLNQTSLNESIKANLDSVEYKSSLSEDPILKVIQKGFPVEKRLTHLKELFIKYKKLTRSQIMEITKIGPSTATKDLSVLLEEGFIVRKSPTKSPRTDYFEIIV